MNTVARVVARRLALALVLLACVAWASPSNKWRLQMSGDADSSGTVVLRLSPAEGAGIDVEVAVPEGAGENACARLVRDAINAAAGRQYETEVDDGEDVLVKRRFGQPDLEITVVSNTVEGLRISIDRE